MVTLTADLFNLYEDRSKTDIDVYLPEFNYVMGVSVHACVLTGTEIQRFSIDG